MTKVNITFTDSEWNELCNLYNQLDALMEDQYPEVSEAGLQLLITNLQATLNSLLLEENVA